MVSVLYEIGKLDQSCFDIYTRWYQGLYLEALVSQHMLCHVLVLLWGSQPERSYKLYNFTLLVKLKFKYC